MLREHQPLLRRRLILQVAFTPTAVASLEGYDLIEEISSDLKELQSKFAPGTTAARPSMMRAGSGHSPQWR
jgi:hypothetical protein